MLKWYGFFGLLNSGINTLAGYIATAFLLLTRQIKFTRRWGWVLEFETIPDAWMTRKFWHKWAGANMAGVIWYRHDYANSPATQKHERQHAWQSFVFGPLQPILYFGHVIIIYLFIKDKHAYLDCWFERDARHAAGQPVDVNWREWYGEDRWPWW